MFTGKKIVAFILMGIVVAPVFIFFSLFIQQKILQHNAEENLEHACLQKIKIKSTEFTWVKENKEILIKGKLFDVRYFTQIKEYVIFTGLFDEDEDVIKKAIADLMHRDNKKEIPYQQLFKFLFSPALSKTICFDVTLKIELLTSQYFIYNEVAILQPQDCSTPPPSI